MKRLLVIVLFLSGVAFGQGTTGWVEIPNSSLSGLGCAYDGTLPIYTCGVTKCNDPGLFGTSGCQMVNRAWAGGCLDKTRNKLHTQGGGHNDYYGNEPYSLDLTALTLTRFALPTVPTFYKWPNANQYLANSGSCGGTNFIDLTRALPVKITGVSSCSYGPYTISSISTDGTTVTVTTSTNHTGTGGAECLLVGDTIGVAGTTNYNGNYIATALPAANQIQFAKSGSFATETVGTFNDYGSPAENCTVAGNCTPNSGGHTYNGLGCIDDYGSAGGMLAWGMTVGCGNAATPKDTWIQDFGALQWLRINQTGDPTKTGNGTHAQALVRDDSQGAGDWWLVTPYNIYLFDWATKTWSQKATVSFPDYQTGDFDPTIGHKFIVLAGGYNKSPSAGGMWVIDTKASPITKTRYLTTTHGGSLSADCDVLLDAYYPGFSWENDSGAFYGLSPIGGDGTTTYVYKVTLDGLGIPTCQRLTYSGGPSTTGTNTAPGNNGLFGRFRCANSICVAALDWNVNAWKLYLTSQSAFDLRCADPNVLRCYSFDTLPSHDVASCGTNDATICPDGYSNYTQVADTTTKVSGAASLKFTIPADAPANQSGAFHVNFSRIGAGQEVFAQWRGRFDTNYINQFYYGGGGWKLLGIGRGDDGGIASSCTTPEVYTQNTDQKGFPQMYHACGLSEPLTPHGGSTIMLENGPPCVYYAPPHTYGAPCFMLVADEWMTFQMHIKVGTWYASGSNNYHRDSTVELWVAREGQPSQLVISLPDYDLYNTDPTNVKYGKIWAMPYHTGRCNGVFQISNINRDVSGVVTATTPYMANVQAWGHRSQNAECDPAGATVTVANVTNPSFNGTFTVATTPDTYTLTWLQAGVVESSTGGTVTNAAHIYTEGYTWYDDLIISTRRIPDPDATTPNPPDSLVATAISSTRVDLAWRSNSTSEIGFKVERCLGAIYSCNVSQNFIQIDTVGAGVTTYSDTTAVNNAKYSYRVRAYNASGDSAYTNNYENTPKPPSDFTVSDNGSAQALLNWQDNANDETAFSIERCTGVSCTSFTEVHQTAANVITWTDTTLAAGNVYRYRVRSLNGAGSWTYWRGTTPDYTNIGTVTITSPPVSIPNKGILIKGVKR